MDYFYAVFLGLLQGATEFLPISSSGHLVLMEAFLEVEQAGLVFDVALHLGTVMAILVYFRHDFVAMARAVFYFTAQGDNEKQMRKLALFICVATVPAVIAGLVWGGAAKTFLRQPAIVACALAGGGALLLWSEKVGRHNRDLGSITFVDVLFIGFSQAFALVPGVSRSGITMTAGLFLGLDRQAVARFSFLLSAPIIFGAGIYHVPEILQHGISDGQLLFFLSGIVTAALSGYLFIAFLLKYIRTRSFEVFAYYRFLVAGIVFLVLLVQ
ncbi:MAG: undecaprenyl-diphosphatase UppP [Desulfobulbaceae bacterium]|nr:undecaprenyl-diphosphatase UppP [Desulfobulbaceae bacterium]MCK5405546.1 undecaprenyl-diphosphatase UppP [Desulfobulbaceae bacterium]